MQIKCMPQSLLLSLLAIVAAAHDNLFTQGTISKSIDVYANFPSRITDFIIGNNSEHWANTSVDISAHTRTVYQCCNGFLLGADGMQVYSHGPNNGTNSWGQSAFIAAGKRIVVNIDPQINSSVSASDVCQAALDRKEEYAQELLIIATRERLSGFITDWEDATGNNMTCFNALFGYVSSVLRPKGLSTSMSMDNSNHQVRTRAAADTTIAIQFRYVCTYV